MQEFIPELDSSIPGLPDYNNWMYIGRASLFYLKLSSVNQDRIICGLFEQIISKNPQITSALFAIIYGLFMDYLWIICRMVCRIVCRII